MPSVSAPVIAAGVGAAGSVASGVIGAGAASSAASTQAAAAQTAAQAQLAMFQEQEQNLQPFMSGGQTGLNALLSMMGLGGSGAAGGVQASALLGNAAIPGGNAIPNAAVPNAIPFQPTMAQLQQTPGYQFTLQQGLLATQNQFGSQGLGLSGAAMKGAAQYAAGLASTTYQQQFNNYQTQYENQIQQFSNTVGLGQTQFSDLLNQQQLGFADTLQQKQQQYNMLGGLTNLGESASAMTANMGMQAQTQANNYLTSGAAASAAGTIGAANSAIGGINGLGGAIQNYAYMSQIPGMFGTPGGTGGVANPQGSYNYGNL